MNCRDADTLMQQSLDQSLTSDQRDRLEVHFQHCAACQRAWDEYRQLTQTTSAWMKQALADDPGDAFTQRVLAQVSARSTASVGSDRGRQWASLAGLTALIGLTVLLAMHAWPGTGGFAVSSWSLPPGSTLMEVPLWLWQNLCALPQDALTALQAASADASVPRWTLAALPCVLLVNGLLIARVWQARRGQIAR